MFFIGCVVAKRQFKPFVSNRVGEIQTKTDPVQWVYTPTKANPADKLTRGTTADSLINDHVRWNGPEYLSQSEEMWPTMPLLATSADDVERKRKYRPTFLASTKTEISMHQLTWKDTKLDPERFSDWFKFLRVIAYVVRFVQNWNVFLNKCNMLIGALFLFISYMKLDTHS